MLKKIGAVVEAYCFVSLPLLIRVTNGFPTDAVRVFYGFSTGVLRVFYGCMRRKCVEDAEKMRRLCVAVTMTDSICATGSKCGMLGKMSHEMCGCILYTRPSAEIDPHE